MMDFNEKYLFEFSNMNPFYALFFEGIFGFFFSIILSFKYDPFKELIKFKKNKPSEFIILIFCLIIFLILSGLKNIFRVSTTKIFTPMATSSLEYILNPIYFIVYFALGKDFMTKGKRNYAYFFINLIIGLIISFSSLVFNELLILFFCNLDKDTYLQVSKRSEEKENNLSLINQNDFDDRAISLTSSLELVCVD